MHEYSTNFVTLNKLIFTSHVTRRILRMSNSVNTHIFFNIYSAISAEDYYYLMHSINVTPCKKIKTLVASLLRETFDVLKQTVK